MNNLRLCTFKEEKDSETSTGYFHTWEQISVGKTAFMRGIVEKENGEVVKVAPTNIVFINNNCNTTILKNDDYDRGLCDAWELAEEMCRLQYNGLEEILGVEYDDMEDHFINFTPQEVIEKFNNK